MENQVDDGHCWDGDYQGQVPWMIPADGNGPPMRYLQVSREEDMKVPQKCCACRARRTRTFKLVRDDDHGTGHEVFYLKDVTPPSERCPGARVPA